ncbi:carboxypeptidase-like regulatory domain-containing protein [Hymenobacter latericus]|uniref:carboxypeptidase-like regulatory domain-containing protein n=1 Tax=Hymenobacter sp. YIM 151858-1 TaxID=2987688 RepID=UPI0022260833|nr:carboxypeptidase-like regulatory domain-containing protein [Hymenobacter sp. YIM 151858-1]UYZ60555.1 carboxypeptidase-like regulatory domain-containing protein [Hymenobacter sp. YIM 151858-1]
MKTTAAFRSLLSALALMLALYATAAVTSRTGQITGTVLDAATKESIPRAHVVLLRARDNAYVATATTAPDGSFRFRNLPFGQYKLRTTILGYEEPHTMLNVNALQPRVNLGKVQLEPLSLPSEQSPLALIQPTQLGTTALIMH